MASFAISPIYFSQSCKMEFEKHVVFGQLNMERAKFDAAIFKKRLNKSKSAQLFFQGQRDKFNRVFIRELKNNSEILHTKLVREKLISEVFSTKIHHLCSLLSISREACIEGYISLTSTALAKTLNILAQDNKKIKHILNSQFHNKTSLEVFISLLIGGVRFGHFASVIDIYSEFKLPWEKENFPFPISLKTSGANVWDRKACAHVTLGKNKPDQIGINPTHTGLFMRFNDWLITNGEVSNFKDKEIIELQKRIYKKCKGDGAAQLKEIIAILRPELNKNDRLENVLLQYGYSSYIQKVALPALYFHKDSIKEKGIFFSLSDLQFLVSNILMGFSSGKKNKLNEKFENVKNIIFQSGKLPNFDFLDKNEEVLAKDEQGQLRLQMGKPFAKIRKEYIASGFEMPKFLDGESLLSYF